MSPARSNPGKTSLTGALDVFRAAERRETIWRALIAALLAIVLTYRLELAAVIYGHGSQIARLQPSAVPPVKFIAATLNDFTFICWLGLVYLGFKILCVRWLPRLTGSLVFKIGEGIFAVALLLSLALVERLHYQLLLQLDTGLTLEFVQTAPALVGPHDFFRMFTWQDTAFFVVPMVVFVLACWFSSAWQRLAGYVFLIFSVIVVGAEFAGPQTLSQPIAANPVMYFTTDAVHEWVNGFFQKKDYYTRFKELPGNAQMNSIQLVDQEFVNPQTPRPAPRREPALTAEGKPWNVLFFVMESTGGDYVFDTSAGNPTPMPFLQKLAGQSLYLSNHFTTANNTIKAAFSLFTGLYPSTSRQIFAARNDVVIPTLNKYLPPEYECFLIHPTPAEFSFPPRLFLNNGFQLFTLETLPPDKRPAPNGLARNEMDSIDFLMARLDRAREPFLGIYWTFIPHFPYSDYGTEFRILPGTTKRQAYYNNLRALDTLLQRVWEHLEKTGVADRTVFVFVGDHGEAFGQHPGVWAHTFGFNAEMFRSPMLFWQPKLISPQVIKFPTSHVDVTPTLLDMLGFARDESRFQGESVLRGMPARKFIFTTDAHCNYISAINPEMIKVILGFHENYFGAFNLAKDPGEKFPLDQKKLWPQAEAIIKFHNYQSQLLTNYNRAILEKQPFPTKN